MVCVFLLQSLLFDILKALSGILMGRTNLQDDEAATLHGTLTSDGKEPERPETVRRNKMTCVWPRDDSFDLLSHCFSPFFLYQFCLTLMICSLLFCYLTRGTKTNPETIWDRARNVSQMGSTSHFHHGKNPEKRLGRAVRTTWRQVG